MQDTSAVSFDNHFAARPNIVATAPGRCSLVGNPTDIYGGTVISCSTRERATCVVYQETKDTVISVSGQSQTVRSLDDLALRDGDYLNVVRAVLLALEIDPASTPPFRIEASTEIPIRAGLAGSTAMLTTVVGAVLAHLGIRLNFYEIAELVRKIEYDVMGVVCGFQDAYMAVFGGLNCMDFRDKISTAVQDAWTPLAMVEPLAGYVGRLPIVLASTGVSHHSGELHAPIRERWERGDAEVVESYMLIARLARAAKKALLATDWDALGDLMNRNHALQRDLGGSGEANERLIDAALKAGAIGAKLAGAGGGGTIVAIGLEPEKLAASLTAAGAARILFPEPSPGLTVEVPV